MQNILNALIFLLHELIENCNFFIVVTLMVSYYVAVTVIHSSKDLTTVQWFFFRPQLKFLRMSLCLYVMHIFIMCTLTCVGIQVLLSAV
jgi:hypothetical protein